ncbi:MAG TPA: hypothetical protein VHV57_02895 [Acidimicrobiales bacterium]|jgi:photosystem II stability/assembly factor-like uncharacterized protein|nr:hypothetical protein [Acidimicrobiales bacterium]
MDAVGQSDLWLTLIDVPGLVPYGQSTDGSDRGAGIDRSADGGRTWSFSSLPGCLQSCGSNLSVSFVNAQYGYASIGPGVSGPSLLFSTDDGGASWVRKGTLPDLGGMLGDGPGSAPQMVFTSASDGWAVTGPTYESNDHSTSSGGVLYRTTDGGNSWVQASHLPSSNQYDLPIFFDTQNGIVLSNAVGLSDTSATVYVTDDGGSTWANRQLPDIPGLRKYKPSGLEFRFDALSPSTWKVDVGSTLYSTTNVGRSWSTIAPIPGIKPGTVEAVDFSSPNYGVALWSQSPKCQESDSAPQLTGCFPTLTATIDGGRIWKPVRP